MRFQAVIFDLDGTLIETERMVIDAGLRAFADLGLPPRRDLLESLVGHVSADMTATFTAAFGPTFDLGRFEAAWDRSFARILEGGIPLRPGVAEFLVHLERIGMPRAVATNSRSTDARANLDRAGILRFFGADRVLGRDMVARPKPAPDVFLAAARTLGVPPDHCLAFEDSDPGAEAARAAGMTVVLVPDQRPPRGSHAHLVAPGMLHGARAYGLM